MSARAAAILAVGIMAGAFLFGGCYTTTFHGSGLFKTNRFTGAVAVYTNGAWHELQP